MTRIHISDSRVKQTQIVDLEHNSIREFVGGAVVGSAMIGEIVRLSFEYVNEKPTFTLQGLTKNIKNGHSWGIKYTRVYTVMED